MDTVGPEEKLVVEAESWLAELLQGLDDVSMYDKDGFHYYKRVREEMARYDRRLRQAISAVVGNWIGGQDTHRAAQARNIAVACAMKEHIPRIRKILHEVKSGVRSDFLAVALEEQIRLLEENDVKNQEALEDREAF